MRMAWARFRSGNEIYRLTDGFIKKANMAGHLGGEATDLEEQMANNIFRLADRPYRSNDFSGYQRPDPLGVWVIGMQSWIDSNVAEPVHSLLENETDPNYRIIIAREGVVGINEAHVPDWSGWIYTAGMRRKKRHASVASFKSKGESLLGMMYDYDHDPQMSATQLLDALEIPLAYAGRSGANFDGVPSNRTQQ